MVGNLHVLLKSPALVHEFVEACQHAVGLPYSWAAGLAGRVRHQVSGARRGVLPHMRSEDTMGNKLRAATSRKTVVTSGVAR